jgi:DNA-binding transcriptional LysR family regulator
LPALGREARQAMDRFQGRVVGELVVGGSTIPGEYVLPELVGRFKRTYPEISICLLIGSSRQVTEWIEESRVEVGIVGARPPGRTLESSPLMADERVVVMNAGHPWARRGTITLDELRSEPMIVRERGSGSREALERPSAAWG